LGQTSSQSFVPFPAQLDYFSKVKIPYPGHVRADQHPKWQEGFTAYQSFRSQHRPEALVPYPQIFVALMGRRFGKTTIAEKVLWQAALVKPDQAGPPNVRVTAPDDEHALKIWRLFEDHLLYRDPLKALLHSYRRDQHLVTLKSPTGEPGATIQRVSGYNPLALAGDAVTCWLIDEMQGMTREAWEALFPSISDRQGVICCFGVAEGTGPFYYLSQQGESPDHPAVLTVRYSSYMNPIVPKYQIEFARRMQPPDRFSQLYLGKWLETTDRVFRGVDKQVLDIEIQDVSAYQMIAPPAPNTNYVAGLDIANRSDWTVHCILEQTSRRLVAWQRMTRESWQIMKEKFFRMHVDYGRPKTETDVTGMGGNMLYEDWTRSGANLQGRLFTNPYKNGILDRLALAITDGQIWYPRIPEMLQELSNMRRVELSRVTRYSAPEGMHDDWPVALALANSALPPYNWDQVAEPVVKTQWTKSAADYI